MLNVYCDGGSRGNPGPAASSFVVYRETKVIYKFSKYIGVNTNNVAEYSAVLFALSYLLRENPNEDICFFLDSELVTKQLRGEYKIKNKNLLKIFLEIKKIREQINSSITFTWTPREKNKLADELVNIALDAQKNKNTTT